MDTLKTVFVVGLLGVVLYFAYTFLSKEEPTPPPEVADLTEEIDDFSPPEVDLGPSLSPDSYGGGPSATAQLSAESSGESPEVEVQTYENSASDNGSSVDQRDDGAAHPTSYGDSDPYASNDPYSSNDPYASSDPYATNDPYLNQNDEGTETGEGDGSVTRLGPQVGSDPSDGSYAPTRPAYGDPVDVAVDGAADGADQPPQSSAASATAAGSTVDWAGEKLIVQQIIGAGKLDDALLYLTRVYQTGLSGEDRQEALDILDPLAGKVIYSREHHLADPYVVAAGESLMQIGAKHQVPWQLLRNINGIENPAAMTAGTELKVLRGPFSAEVDRETNEMTLYVNGRYAGRFAVRLGANPPPAAGRFQVLSKQEGKAFVSDDGTVPQDAKDNPYGRVWLDLGNSLGIHGSHSPEPNPLGCISLSQQDAVDIYAILSEGSRVTIR